MARTLKSLENQAKLEGERARQAHDFEYEVEHRLTNRLKDIISDLRKSWEEEEVTRIRQVEEKIRNNYNIVLEHMEAQLKMALQLQDDADSKWLEDLDHRNKKQLESIRMFEEKCRQLYETRLAEYAEKSSSQIAAYEEKLLEVFFISSIYLCFFCYYFDCTTLFVAVCIKLIFCMKMLHLWEFCKVHSVVFHCLILYVYMFCFMLFIFICELK